MTCPIQTAITLLNRTEFPEKSGHNFRNPHLAAAIPRDAPKPPPERHPDLLRKDLTFLLERYFYLLEHYKSEMGLIVLDETDKQQDRHFVRILERYFRESPIGRYRSTKIVPSPFFVSSDLNYPIQVADVVMVVSVKW